MKMILFLARHELRLVLKEPQFFIPYLLVPLITIGIYGFFIFSSGTTEMESLYISRLTVVLVGVLVASMSLALCADSFAGEKERNTLETLLCAPPGLRSLFLGKLLGVMPFPILAGWVGQIVLLVLANVHSPGIWDGGEIFSALALTPVTALFITAISIYISLRTSSVRSAAQLSGIFVLGYLFSAQFIFNWYFTSFVHVCGVLGVVLLVSFFLILLNINTFKKGIS
ncbi:MAG: ABC transporter permease subunit [Fibrobacteria bacterium]|nr:ABC transporter permease subunit [Fibrobacteria bacterium]